MKFKLIQEDMYSMINTPRIKELDQQLPYYNNKAIDIIKQIPECSNIDFSKLKFKVTASNPRETGWIACLERRNNIIYYSRGMFEENWGSSYAGPDFEEQYIMSVVLHEILHYAANSISIKNGDFNPDGSITEQGLKNLNPYDEGHYPLWCKLAEEVNKIYQSPYPVSRYGYLRPIEQSISSRRQNSIQKQRDDMKKGLLSSQYGRYAVPFTVTCNNCKHELTYPAGRIRDKVTKLFLKTPNLKNKDTGEYIFTCSFCNTGGHFWVVTDEGEIISR